MGKIPSALMLTTLGIAVFSSSASAEVKKWTATELPLRADDVVQLLAFSPDGKVLAAVVRHYEPELRTYQQEIALLNVPKRKEVGRLTGPKGNWVNTLQFSLDGRLLAVRCVGELLTLWDVRSGKRLRAFEDTKKIEQFLITADGKLLVGRVARDRVKKGDNYLLGVWDVSTGKRLRWIEPGPHGEIWAFSMAADSEHVLLAQYQYIVLGSAGEPTDEVRGTVHVRNLRTGEDRGAVGKENRWAQDLFWNIPRGWMLHAARAPARDEWRSDGSRWSYLDREWCGRLAFSATGQAVVLPDYRPAGPILARWDRTLHLLDPIKQSQFDAFERTSELKAVDGAVLLSDGEQLATWKRKKGASTVLLWDVKDLAAEVRAHDQHPDKEPSALWAALAGEEVPTIHRAMRLLAAVPDRGVALIRERLRPVKDERIDEKQIQRWIAELDAEAFEVRDRATEALRRFGSYLKPTLQKALTTASSLETKRRLEDLLGSMKQPTTPDELRQMRAIDVLEQIDTREARRLLRTLADGAAYAPLTLAARQALERLERKGKER